MNSSEIYDAIEVIADTSSTKDKIALLSGLCNDENFKRVLVAAYDPNVTYGIAIIPAFVPTLENHDFGVYTWALLKRLSLREVTGSTAIHALENELSRLNNKSATLLSRIIKKDLRAGIDAKTINKACKGLIKEYPYMRCSLPKNVDLNKYDWKRGVISQEKADGMFANITIDELGETSILSRQGSEFPKGAFANLILECVTRLKFGYQYHGELVVYRNNEPLPREQSNGILNHVLKGGSFGPFERPKFFVWDMVLIKQQEIGQYRIRLAKLMKFLLMNDGEYISLIPTRLAFSLEEAYEHYHELIAQGKEGTIIKNPSGVWKNGTSKDCCKLKLEVDVDLEVIDFLPGEGKNADTFGSILCRTHDDLLHVAVSGFSDDLRKEIHENRELIQHRVMTVRANSVMKPQKPDGKYSLFLPRFVEFRPIADKILADSLQQVLDQFDSAAKKAA